MSKWCRTSILKLHDELSFTESSPARIESVITDLVCRDKVKSRYSRNPRLIKFLLAKARRKRRTVLL